MSLLYTMRSPYFIMLVMVFGFVGAESAASHADDTTKTLMQARHFDTGFESDGTPKLIPSTDPSGIAYHSPSGHLFIADSEINEIPEVWGLIAANVFEVSPSGDVLFSSYDLGNSEPTGIVFNEFDDHFYVTNDDTKRIYRYSFNGVSFAEVDSKSTSVDGLNDPEGITAAPDTGVLYVVDGMESKVASYRYEKEFILLEVVDLQVSIPDPFECPDDPEGIAFHAMSGHLFLVSDPDRSVFELTTAGEFIARYDLGCFQPSTVAPQGLTFGDPSMSRQSGGSALFIADGGIDNGEDPDERDGAIYEGLFSQIEPSEGGSLSYDGDDDVTKVDYTPNLYPEQITIAAWINPSVTGPNHYIVSTKQNGGYSLGLNITTGGSSHPNVLTSRTMVDGTYYNTYGVTELLVGIWTHVAVTYNGSEFMLYVDGEEDGVLSAPGALTPSAILSDLFFGAESAGNEPGGGYFQGRIDEVAIFGVALNSEEIAVLSCAPMDSTHPAWDELIGYWPFDTTVDGITPDHSGNGHDGAIQGPVLCSIGAPFADRDGDGYEKDVCGGDDCDDADADVNPGMQGQDCLETPDGVDNDCDGAIDDDSCQGCFISALL